MRKLNIKPLSVNQCWQGQRFKTKEYLQYEQNVLLMLPKIKVPEPPFRLELEFGFSNMASDLDNPVKPFVDILQKKYGINDKHILELNILKHKVEKGKEFIKFELKSLQ